MTDPVFRIVRFASHDAPWSTSNCEIESRQRECHSDTDSTLLGLVLHCVMLSFNESLQRFRWPPRKHDPLGSSSRRWSLADVCHLYVASPTTVCIDERCFYVGYVSEFENSSIRLFAPPFYASYASHVKTVLFSVCSDDIAQEKDHVVR